MYAHGHNLCVCTRVCVCTCACVRSCVCVHARVHAHVCMCNGARIMSSSLCRCKCVECVNVHNQASPCKSSRARPSWQRTQRTSEPVLVCKLERKKVSFARIHHGAHLQNADALVMHASTVQACEQMAHYIQRTVCACTWKYYIT